MAITRTEARAKHAGETGHEQFSETIYGVICANCHNYVLIDQTNCPRTCREHETCRAAYS